MKKILIAPLDWGLGHATRCIPIIRELLKRSCDVCVAGSGDSLALLKDEFPSLTSFSLPGYRPVYQSYGSMVWKMAAQLPRFMAVIKEEHRRIERLIVENKIDIVISDNRYGCWSARIPSVFMTHQCNILMPKGLDWLAGWVGRANEKLMDRFSFRWIPDYPGESSLAGDLTLFRRKVGPGRMNYVGNLSRFSIARERDIKYDVVVILSGPEPQRTILEKIIVKQVFQSGLKYLIVRGVLSLTNFKEQNIDTVNFLNSEQLQAVIEQSRYIIARSGFSTVMDLAKLGKKAIFIPTPGQTEQEYLARRLMKLKIAYAMDQGTFDLNSALRESDSYTGFGSIQGNFSLMEDAITKLLDSAMIND